MSTPVEGGRPLLRGRLFGFPVHLDLSFVIIMGILGYYDGISVTEMVIWLLITPVAVLVHELGHAVTARAAGAEPEIALAGFGGVTTYTPPRPLSRLRSIGISVAGPGVGLAIGAVIVVVQNSVGDTLARDSWQWIALDTGAFTTIWWSLLNLLPILPLDGGQAVREVLPGSPEVRTRRAAMVSVVVGAIAAVVAYTLVGSPFLALFMGFFVVSNALALREPSGPRQVEIGHHPGAIAPEQAVVGLIWNGQATRAREVMEQLPPELRVDLVVHGAVLYLTGDRAQGKALLDQEGLARPEDRNVAALTMLAFGLGHDWDATTATLQGPIGPAVPPQVTERIIEEARGLGREDVAGRLTVLARGA